MKKLNSFLGAPRKSGTGRTWQGITSQVLAVAIMYSLLVGCWAADAAPDPVLVAQATGSVQATLSPAAAITAGARWRIDGGAWRVSGTTATGIVAGAHTISFRAATGYKTPASQSVDVVALETATVNATYSLTGSVTAAILPELAASEGAKWRVDTGAWQLSNATLTNITVGAHTVSFKTTNGWITPTAVPIDVVAGGTSSASGTYAPVGKVSISMLPTAAISAGARWRIDAGSWRTSGTTLSNINEGPHTVSFRVLSGWITPPSISINVVHAQTASGTGTYLPVGKVQVTLGPVVVIPLGARWALDNGAWRASGYTLRNVAEGPHTLTFKPVTGWTTPAALSIEVAQGQTIVTSGEYTQGGKVSVEILPSPAVSDGAKWALDGGNWNDSGTTLVNIPAGPHTITYSAIAGWTTPPNASINVLEGGTASASPVFQLTLGSYVAFANNDLGMHCMNSDFSEFMILPPYNTVHAQVLRRGAEPHIMTNGISINYRVLGNTTSVTKTNFWQYTTALFGATVAPDVGLTGNRLSGIMAHSPTDEADYVVTGIPLTQISDNGENQPLQMGEFKVFQGNTQIARTNTVLPVSWEISCELCHNEPGASVATNILRSHDRLHSTDLEHAKPVVCGACHAQPPLGLAGAPNVSSLSSAMHTAHAERIPTLGLENGCYACHPGITTQCLRDIHVAKGMSCTDCHGDMAAVGNPVRRSWVDEPRCGDCHQRSHFSFEQPGKLYRDSKGHHEIECWVCHGSPHAITPTVTTEDNTQALMFQGHAGVMDCVVCHINKPRDEFEHHL